MSERGSFCTEYVYCPKCFDVLRRRLVTDGKFLRGVAIPMWSECANQGECLPIIAGKIGGHSFGEELYAMEFEYAPLFENDLCHPVRIAVIPENGEAKVFVFGPGA